MNGNSSFQKREPINGFPKFADAITQDPDRTGTIYRRFDRLASRDLLLMEAEIAELEALQDRYDEDDRAIHDDVTCESHSKWSAFERLAEERDPNGDFLHPQIHERMRLALSIRDKLLKYHEALARHQLLLNLSRPAPTTVRGMKNMFRGEQNGQGQMYSGPQLWGRSEQRFDDVDDLVALKVLANQDRLSQFVLNHCGWLFRERQSHGTSVVISERSVDKATTVLSSIISAMVLFGSIVSLYFVQNPYALLGMVGGWTILFAVCVGVLTNAKRDQIFAATAAFAAVLVVFVGESLDKGRGGGSGGPEGITGNCTCTPT
ncbi:hypothetical protein PGQ11_011187 [Apiospora arundinis]|uniref:DUF6594 domain-containing protein n=1 Tax=Apiospora arundinis TaxID=335852 RepID=A0ABR2HZX1_9PEZI